MTRHFLQAFALMFVLEGLLPLTLPALWKGTFMKLAALSEGQIRFVGLISLASGYFLFNWVE